MSEVSEGGGKDNGKRDEGRGTGGSEQRGNGNDKGNSEKGKVSKTYGKRKCLLYYLQGEKGSCCS